MGSNGRPEPTSAVAAVVLLGLGSCAAFFFLLAMRWATWAVLGVLAHLAMRKPNVSDSLPLALGSAATISAAMQLLRPAFAHDVQAGNRPTELNDCLGRCYRRHGSSQARSERPRGRPPLPSLIMPLWLRVPTDRAQTRLRGVSAAGFC